MFSRPAHKLAGQSYVGKILVLDTAKGGVATRLDAARDAIARHGAAGDRVQQRSIRSWRRARRSATRRCSPDFDEDITRAIPNGAELEIDPAARVVKVLS